MNIVLINYPGVTSARVHAGFYNSYKDVQSRLMSTIKSQVSKYADYAVHVTGYVQGFYFYFLKSMCYYYILYGHTKLLSLTRYYYLYTIVITINELHRHSLGGATALFNALDLHENGITNIRLITQGTLYLTIYLEITVVYE